MMYALHFSRRGWVPGTPARPCLMYWSADFFTGLECLVLANGEPLAAQRMRDPVPLWRGAWMCMAGTIYVRSLAILVQTCRRLNTGAFVMLWIVLEPCGL